MSGKYTWDNAGDLEPGLHISRKDRKHMVANTFSKLFMFALVFHGCNDRRYSDFTRNICN